MGCVGVEDKVVNFVGEDQQIVTAGDVDDALQGLLGEYGSSGVIGVDDDNGLGLVSDLGLNVLEAGVPVVGFVQQVVDGGAAGKSSGSRPQRVVRGGEEDFVAWVAESLQGHGDELGRTVANVDAIHVEVGEARSVGVPVDDGLAGGCDTAGVGVADGIVELLLHIVGDVLWGQEAELTRVADVELQDLGALRLEFIGAVQHRAADVVDDILQFLGLVERAKTHCALFCKLFGVLVQKLDYTCSPPAHYQFPLVSGGS